MAHKTRNIQFTNPNGSTRLSKASIWDTGKILGPRQYDMQFSYGLSNIDSSASGPLYPVIGSAPPCNPTGNDFALAKSRAIAQFSESMSDSATWANNLHEMGTNVDAVTAHCKTLTGFANALDRGAPASYLANLLGLGARSKWGKAKAVGKTFADAWLEWHFGWEPFVQDIGAAVSRICDNQSFSKVIKGRSTGVQTVSLRSDLGSVIQIQNSKVTHHFLVQGTVTLASPILGSLNAMGFVNPLSVAWEAVPYSFVADWFSNVGQVLGQSTMFTGFSAQGMFSTWYGSGSQMISSYSKPSSKPGPPGFSQNSGTSAGMQRRLGFPGASLVWKPFRGFSTTRGATAASLLAQLLSSH